MTLLFPALAVTVEVFVDIVPAVLHYHVDGVALPIGILDSTARDVADVLVLVHTRPKSN